MKSQPTNAWVTAGDQARVPAETQCIDWYAEGEERIVEAGGVQIAVRFVGRKGRRGRIAITAPPGATFQLRAATRLSSGHTIPVNGPLAYGVAVRPASPKRRSTWAEFSLDDISCNGQLLLATCRRTPGPLQCRVDMHFPVHTRNCVDAGRTRSRSTEEGNTGSGRLVCPCCPASIRAGMLENGLDPAHSQLVSAITGEPVICYASLTRLGKDLVEIGQSINEHRLFVIVIRAANFKENHVFPDTTHQELADAQDAPDALSRSIDDYRAHPTRRIVTAVGVCRFLHDSQPLQLAAPSRGSEIMG